MGNTTEVEQKKPRRSLLHYLYPTMDFGGGIWKAYYNTYLAMLYTDIYMIPVALSGVLELIQQIMGWVAAPTWGTVLDRVTLKKGKYWQWTLLGATMVTVCYMVTFGLPAISSNPAGLAPVIFIVAILTAVFQVITDTTGVSLYPRLGDTSADRSFLAIGRSLGRTGSKTIFGALVPIMLVALTAAGGSERMGWATTSLILGPAGLLFYVLFALFLRRSDIEKKAIAERDAVKSGGKKNQSLAVIFKSLITNKPLLIMFAFFCIHKMYDLGLQTTTASYFFKYYQQNFGSMALFMSARTFAQFGGALFGIIWLKMWKDTKRAFVSAGLCHIIVLGISALVISRLNTMQFILIMIPSSFFVGVLEAYTLPFFAAACDYGEWKSGVRADGLNMSTYSLSLRVSTTFMTTVRVAILAAVGYNAKAYDAGEAVSQAVLTQLANFHTLYPFILAIICIGLVAFFFPINDKKLKEIKDELARRKAGGAASGA